MRLFSNGSPFNKSGKRELTWKSQKKKITNRVEKQTKWGCIAKNALFSTPHKLALVVTEKAAAHVQK